MRDKTSIREILDFWFLPLANHGHGKEREIWFRSTPAFDAEIVEQFAGALGRAVRGECDSWVQSPDGALALIVLCDQFPRHIHRRTALAYRGDGKALWAARRALARFYPALFPPAMRVFFYMPFQHSESLADQELGCALFEVMENDENMKYAIEHRDIVARFGRFPHRNDVLGRASSEAELKFLKSANRFGQ
ncbi:MAG: DUF924 domain-containing protein [Enhydrobacter sp.]|nr:MAG: DUF924 domain-containing protein [Enhydrobacter sp.]